MRVKLVLAIIIVIGLVFFKIDFILLWWMVHG